MISIDKSKDHGAGSFQVEFLEKISAGFKYFCGICVVSYTLNKISFELE